MEGRSGGMRKEDREEQEWRRRGGWQGKIEEGRGEGERKRELLFFL